MHRVCAIAIIALFFMVTAYGQEQYSVETITIRESLLRAIQANLDLKIEGFNPKLNEFDIIIARSAFDPVFTASYLYTSTERQQANLVASGESIDAQLSVGVRKSNVLGGTVGLFYNINYGKILDNNNFIILNPRWEHTVSLEITQPLLRNMGVELNNNSIAIAENNYDQSLFAFQGRALAVLTSVQLAYLDLVNARENYELQRQSLRLSENFYKITAARIKAGSLAAADILDAERDVAFKRDNLIVAEKNVLTTEDILKQLIRPLDVQYYKNVRLIPVDRPIFEPREVNFEASLDHALKNRVDLKQSLVALRTSSINVAVQKNQLLPRLDFAGSIELQGLGGNNDEGFEPVSEGEFPTWSVQLTLEIPIGNRAAEARYQQALLERRQLETQHRRLQSQVILDIRNTTRDLETAARRVTTARTTRELAEKQLANEENKFRAGILALFQLQSTEQKLTEARINEVNALIDYQKAIVALERAEGALGRSLGRYNIKLTK